MDAKNSPLALLAQTCSAIGADAPNPKLIANMEKSGKNLQKSDSRDKSSPGSQSSLSNSSSESHPKSSFKPYEPSFRDRSTTTPEDYRSQSASNNHRIKTPKQVHLAQVQPNGRCDSNQSAASPRSSPAVSSRKSSLQQQHPINLEKSASPSASNHRASVTSKEATSSSSRSAQESPLYSSSKLSEATKESSVSYPKISTSLSSASSASSVPPFFGAYGPGLPYPMDLMTASALMSPHHAMLKAASMNPYLNYANRMKMSGANGSDPLGCRDPFCTGCALTPHPVGKCPAGCQQCEPSSGSAPKSSYAHQMSQAFAHAALAAASQMPAFAAASQIPAFAAASQMPYICNWIAGDASYCGKRFSSSDDLLQHLRTHTSSMPESMLNPATAGLPPTHPLLQRTYPTPPLSPLSGSRYHPYSKPSVLPPSLHPSLAGLPLSHPSLAPYFSPYSLYGRLGTSSSMHP